MLSTSIPYAYTFHAPVYKEVVGERQSAYRAPGPVSNATVSDEEHRAPGPGARVDRGDGNSSEFVAGEMRAKIARPGRTDLAQIPGGLKTDYFSPKLGLEPPIDLSRPIILTARRLVERTGVELLVAAMPEILEQHPTAQLVITGDGPVEDQSSSSSLNWPSTTLCTCWDASAMTTC